MCAAGQRVSLTITGPGPSFLCHWHGLLVPLILTETLVNAFLQGASEMIHSLFSVKISTKARLHTSQVDLILRNSSKDISARVVESTTFAYHAINSNINWPMSK